MEALGYPLSWRTHCFISGGCGAENLFGHTNGYGDFVLFDQLQPPWPVHECYLRRFELSSSGTVLRVGQSRSVDAWLPDTFKRPWDHVVRVTPTADQYWKEIDIIGTVVDTFDSLAEWRSEFQLVYGPERMKLNDQIHRSRSVVRLVTGDGDEYYALYDPVKYPLRFQDIITVTLKVKPVLFEYQFFVIGYKRFRVDGGRAKAARKLGAVDPVSS